MTATDLTIDDLGVITDAMHSPDGPFRGFEVLGYVGNSQRNYVTDAWVVGANELGWCMFELAEWMGSVYGRHALDAEPMDAAAMLEEMRRADMAALWAEATTNEPRW